MRVLIADDNEIVRKVAERILQSRGDIQCIEAESGDEAVQKAIALEPDIVILDISMPRSDGFEVAKDLKQYLPTTPILFFSVYDNRHYVEKARSIGEGLVVKDQAAAVLLEAIDALAQGKTFFPPTPSI